MSFLNRLLGKKSTPPDPTIDWPTYQDIERIVIPHEGRFGDLKFGDSIDLARPFGKPAKNLGVDLRNCSLIYPQGGFELYFSNNRFTYMAFYTDRHIAEQEIEGGFNLAIINLMLANGKTVQLSKDFKRKDIEELFSKPSNIDFSSDETILFYEDQNLTMEFELQPNDGTLMRMNLYPTEG
jgi:hypothetical protein